MQLEELQRPLQTEFPDPFLTANLYSANHLDQLISQVIAPFWRDRSQKVTDRAEFLWFLRYKRCGEHLKIRLHGLESNVSLLKRSLEELARSYFSITFSSVEAAAPTAPTRVPPMDDEDEATSDYPDGTLLWTHYRRSSIILGRGPLLSDGHYAALFTECLGRGCEFILGVFESAGSGKLPHGRRQAALISLLMTGLTALWRSREEQRAYLAYHRDWLIRHPVLRRRLGEPVARKILERYEREAQSHTAQATIGRLKETMRRQSLYRPKADAGSPEALWISSLLKLRDYLETFQDDPDWDCRIDPFTKSPFLPTAFKLFHCMANQLGLNALNEGLAYHLLLHALGQEKGTHCFALTPSPRAPSNIDASPESMDRVEPERAFNFERDYHWRELIAATGSNGQCWQEEYRHRSVEILALLKEAAAALRRRQIDQSQAFLHSADSLRQWLRSTNPSIFHAVGRFYYGGLSYFYYCIEDFDRADWALQEAHESIRATVECHPFLLPFAALSADIPLKRARVAVTRSRWEEAREHTEALRETAEDRRPLCQLSDETPIYHSTLGELFSSIDPLEDRLIPSVQYFQDAQLRINLAQRLIEGVYALPGFLIPYP